MRKHFIRMHMGYLNVASCNSKTSCQEPFNYALVVSELWQY